MNARTPFLVGLVLLVALGGITCLVMITGKDRFSKSSTYPIYANFDNASGIRWKTRVQINGIDVGKIINIAHIHDSNGRLKARVTMLIANEYNIYDNATLSKASESLLGDFRLDLDPGSPDHAKLKAYDTIKHCNSTTEMDEIKSQLLQVSRNVNQISQSFSNVLSGAEGEGSLKSILNKVESSINSINITTKALETTVVGNEHIFNDIIYNIDLVAKAMMHVSKPGGDMQKFSKNLAAVSEKLNMIADDIHLAMTNPADANSKSGMKNTFGNLNESLTHVNNITRKIDDGQGTLGRVVNDPSIAEKVETTLDSANEIIGNIAGLETQIELRSEYDVPFAGTNNEVTPSIKNTLALRIIPKPDKYYIIEAISDPRGYQKRTLSTTVVNDQNVPIVADQTVIAFEALTYSLEFAKRYGFLTMRFGIIENSGGLGINLHGFKDRGEVRIDAYDFDRRDPDKFKSIQPRLRFTAMYELFDHISLQAGIDDPLNSKLFTWFSGGVLRFTDDDLKALLTVAPRP